MTTHFQKHTRRHTHTPGTSLGSVRGRYRPYFITDFTHVSNHKIRVSHFSGQTQTFPFHPSRLSVHPSDQSQAQSTGCSASSHTPFANCQDPIPPPPERTHKPTLNCTQIRAHTATIPSTSNKRNCQLSTFIEWTKEVLWEKHFERK